VPKPVGRVDGRRRARPDLALDKEIKRLVERSTAAQNVPFHVADEAVLARVAALVRAVIGKHPSRHAS
jgi:hypothetical protein